MLLGINPEGDLLYRPEGLGHELPGKVSGSGGVLGFSEDLHIFCVASVNPFTTHSLKKVRTT